MNHTSPQRWLSRIIDVRTSGENAFVVAMARPDGFEFLPGHHIRVGCPHGDNREYSIYSAPRESNLEILVRLVPEGTISPWLQVREAGDTVTIDGPMGEFLLPEDPDSHHYLFVATGTGIAPYRSMLETHPLLDYQLLHGLRTDADRPRERIGDSTRTTLCLSRQNEHTNGFSGRVTELLRQTPPAPSAHCYLCGSCDMIYDAVSILSDAGIPRDHIHAETYY
jgi:ferredoxin--NADP+ reductase